MTIWILGIGTLLIPMFVFPGLDTARLPKEFLFQVVAVSSAVVAGIEFWPFRIPWRLAVPASGLLLLSLRGNPGSAWNLACWFLLVFAASRVLDGPHFRLLARLNILPVVFVAVLSLFQSERIRMGTVVGDVDSCALYLVISVVLAVTICSWKSVFVLCPLPVVALLRMQNITGIVALVAGLVVVFLIQPSVRAQWKILVAAFCVLVAGAAEPMILSRLAGRLDVWKITVSAALRHPWFGVGIGRFEPVFFAEKISNFRGIWFERPWQFAHNEILQGWVEIGLVGLLLFLALLVLLPWRPEMFPAEVALAVGSVAFFPLHLGLFMFWAAVLSSGLSSYSSAFYRRRTLPAGFAVAIVVVTGFGLCRPLITNYRIEFANAEIAGQQETFSPIIPRALASLLACQYWSGSDPQLQRSLGVALFEHGAVLDSLEPLARSFAARPNSDTAFNFALALSKAGRRDEALRVVNSGLAFNERHKRSVELRSSLF